ncbi:MAG: Flp pilus assembly complex ATPase component TadA [Candidatus Omnitrophica bacterium]|nr:Flp pilus assembly complex ATPase component TadA [Candidatus Omnitrophota bacterium]
MAENKTDKLGEVLIAEGLINRQQLGSALQIQNNDNRRLGDILVSEGFVSDVQLSQILARIHKLPFVNLADIQIKEDVFAVVAMDLLEQHKVLPIEIKGITLVVATNNPLDVSGLQEIQYMSGLQVKPVIAGREDIETHLKKYSESIHTVRTIKLVKDSGADSAPIIKMVEALIGMAIKERVSDIHLEPMAQHMRVRFRIDGVLYEKAPVPKDMERKVLSRIKILSGMDVADSRRPQDGRMTLPEQYKNFDVRVSTLPDIMGENMVLRLLDKSFTKFSFDSLGMDEVEIDMIKKLVTRPYGIMLVTGPTGAGKTTTLYSVLNSLNHPTRNIITVEDPVEYKIPGINQTLINTKSGYTFATAIRHILRHDPNVIMIGEIRDVETAEIAIRAALTGHLVLSTLHTNTAAGAIMRLLDMNIEPFLIQSSMIAVIAQRLVRRLCPKCKKEYIPSDEVRESIARYCEVPKDITLASPVGCEQCFQTGFAGRVAVYELLNVNEGIRNLILKAPSEHDITQLAVSKGMKTLRKAGLDKALKKVTSLEEVMGISFMEEDSHG